MSDLQERQDIVVTKADNAGAVVVTAVDDYIKEANQQFSDQRFCKKIELSPTSLHATLVHNAINDLKLQGHLDEKMANQLKTNNPKSSRLYLLPKIHKPGNPGCHAEGISQYIDHHLNKALPSYVQDMTDFLRKLDDIPEVSDETILVKKEVWSLYSNVPNDEGIEAVKSYL